MKTAAMAGGAIPETRVYVVGEDFDHRNKNGMYPDAASCVGQILEKLIR